MEQLSVAREDEASRFAADMAALRDKVADVLQRMFSNAIDEPAALEALRELGCEVRYVPGACRAGAPATRCAAILGAGPLGCSGCPVPRLHGNAQVWPHR